jgi:hypothetical protein
MNGFLLIKEVFNKPIVRNEYTIQQHRFKETTYCISLKFLYPHIITILDKWPLSINEEGPDMRMHLHPRI